MVPEKGEMRKLILLLIAIILGACSGTFAGNDLETVANFEEGSSFYDLTYGAKLINSAQDPNRVKYDPRYTKQELDTAVNTLADTDSMLQSSTSLASLESAVGEATLGTETAIPALNFADYLTYLMLQHQLGYLTQAELNQRIIQIQNQMPQLYNQQQYTSIANQRFQQVITQLGPLQPPLTLAQFIANSPPIQGLSPEQQIAAYNNGYLPGYQQYVAAPYTTNVNNLMNQTLTGNWTTTSLTQAQINANYPSYTNSWWAQYNGQVAQLPQPPIIDQAAYDAQNAQTNLEHQQTYPLTHPTDSARNY